MKPDMKKYIIVALFFLFCFSISYSQKEKDTLDPVVKKGWTLGAVPVVAYNSDLGFKYGGLVNLYYYGDGNTYPKYLQMIRVEVSRTTKGGGANQLFFDSRRTFSKPIRYTADLSYLTEQALHFYGFNGREALYNAGYEDSDSEEYISRMYYRHRREMIRFTNDFQGEIIGNKFRWLAGFAHYTYKIGSVDIDRLNKGKDDADKLPDTTGLYDQYVDWGLIDQEDKDGGSMNLIRLGLIYDTRDIEANPMKGMWTEFLIVTGPRFLANKEKPFTKLVIIHRQYFTLVKNKLSFVYRLGYQGTISGTPPFYVQPYMFVSWSPSTMTEGLGGSKSLRGILRNRIVGDAIAYANIGFRWKFLQTVIKKQNVYLALNTFLDAGQVTKKHKIDYSKAPFPAQNDRMHFSYGLGLHIALNENFVVSCNYGRAVDAQDGRDGLYISTNWLF